MGARTTSGTKHPDNMSRKEKLQMIAFLDDKEAAIFWIKHCSGISRAAFEKARS